MWDAYNIINNEPIKTMTTTIINNYNGIELGTSCKGRGWDMEEIHTGNAERSTAKAIKFSGMDWIAFSMIEGIVMAEDSNGVLSIDSIIIPAWLAKKI